MRYGEISVLCLRGMPAITSRFNHTVPCAVKRAEIIDGIMAESILPSGNQKRFADISAQLWTCCQSRCQLAISEGYSTYGNGGEGNRTPVLVAIHAAIYMFIRR